MSNISVTTTQSVIAVTQTGGITVTTPEGQTIAVTVPNSSVNVTNTTDDITITEVGITNTDQLIEGTTNLFFTNARARAAVSLTTDDSSILDYNSTTGVFTWDTPTTTKINEGTNLYYTTARANSDFDTRLATKTTTNLAEGTNQYFTTARARQSLSAGTGISYDNSTGVITNISINTDTTYTIDASTATGGANLNLVGSDATTDTVKIANGTNVSVSRTDANTITIASTDTNTTYTQNASAATGGANLNLVGSDSTTDTVKFANGTNVTVTRTDADTITIAATDTNTTYTVDATATTGGANLNLTGSDSSTDSVAYLGSGATTITRTDANTITVSSTDTNTTYTQNFSSTTGGTNLNLVGSDATTDTVKFANGTGVTVTRTDADTATIAIGQPVATTDNVQFNNITLSGDINDTGALQISTGANGNLTLAPNGTGSVALTLADGGNLTNTRNYVKGVIRNSTLAAAGEIWAVNSTGPVNPFQGISIDNSADTTTGPGTILRSFTGGAVAGNGIRGRIVFEKARGTSASPTAVQLADILGSVDATGYTSTGWLNDNIAAVTPAFFGFTASENWVSNTNLGTQFNLSLTPTATTVTSNAQSVTTINSSPETVGLRSDRMALSQGKTVAFTATGCSTSGTTLTIGTLVSGTIGVGNVITQATAQIALGNHYIVANISGSGSGSTWRLGGSPGTLSAQAITGNIGMIGSNPVTSNTLDALRPLRLISPTISNAVATDNLNLFNYATRIQYASTENYSGNSLTLKPGQLAGATGYDRQTEISVVQNTTDGTSRASFEVKTQRFDGTNYSPTVSGDSIGRFIFNGNTATGATPATSSAGGASLITFATETWTGSVSGTRMTFNITKTGTNTGLEVASLASTASTFKSDAYTFQDSNGTTLAVIDANKAQFNVPVTTEITSTTINEGTTYTPAATVDNNISVQINALSGGTTVIDLASLTGNTRGASYNILVFNNTASGTPIQVKNTRINTNNLMTHTITTGSPRIIINAYVVGDYATATHLVVA